MGILAGRVKSSTRLASTGQLGCHIDIWSKSFLEAPIRFFARTGEADMLSPLPTTIVSSGLM